MSKELTQDDIIQILKLIEESPAVRVSLQYGDLRLEVDKRAECPGDPVSLLEASGFSITDRLEDNRVDAGRVPPGVIDAPETEQLSASDEDNFVVIKAPLLGIFYRRPDPASPVYVEEGSVVDEDTTVALIEVMKLFNPVKAGVKGRIHRICVESNDLVEYGQVLFLVTPESG